MNLEQNEDYLTSDIIQNIYRVTNQNVTWFYNSQLRDDMSLATFLRALRGQAVKDFHVDTISQKYFNYLDLLEAGYSEAVASGVTLLLTSVQDALGYPINNDNLKLLTELQDSLKTFKKKYTSEGL